MAGLDCRRSSVTPSIIGWAPVLPRVTVQTLWSCWGRSCTQQLGRDANWAL